MNGFLHSVGERVVIYDGAMGTSIQARNPSVDDFWGKGDYLRSGHIVAGSPAVYPFLQEQVKSRLAPVLEP